MNAEPTTVHMNSTDSVSGHLQIQSDADQSVILTYVATNACTGGPVPASVVNVGYDRAHHVQGQATEASRFARWMPRQDCTASR